MFAFITKPLQYGRGRQRHPERPDTAAAVNGKPEARGQPAADQQGPGDWDRRTQPEPKRPWRNGTVALEAANSELGAFSYSVSHDLRAPLRSIGGFSQALLEDYTERLDEQGKDYLNRVHQSSRRMGQLIDDLLKLSGVTRTEIRREDVDLSAQAHAIADECRRTQPEREAEFVIADGVVASGDTHLLRAVLENLIGNAWKFTGKHPGARIEFGTTEHESKKTYFVQDNGAGFEMEYSDKLFGAFQRLHTADEFEGTGIGLATVRRIINRHGGEVWAEGQLEKGATFYFTLG